MKNKNFINNSAWIIGGKIIQMILTLIIGAISARYLGPSNYGLINYGASYTALFTPIIALGLYGIIVNEIVNNPIKDGVILGSAIGMRAVTAIVSSICIVGIVVVVNPNQQLLWLVTALQCTAVLFQWCDVFNYWCQARYDSKAAVIIQLFAYILTSAYKIYLLIAKKSVLWFAFSMGLDYILQAVFYVVYFQKNGQSKLSFELKKAKQLLGQSYHYVFSSLASVIYSQIDRIMLGSQISATVVGFYTAASTISSMWTFILSAIIDSVRPAIISIRKIDMRQYKYRITQLYSFIIYMSIFVSVIMCLMSRIFIIIIYGQDYLEAQVTLCILTWSTCFSYLGVARSIWCVCEGKQKYEKYLSITGAIINVILNAIMIPIWSINGAAIATLITQFATSFVVPMAIREMRENSLFIIKAFNPRCFINKEFYSVVKGICSRNR